MAAQRTLYLTADERKQYDSLPTSIREEWQTAEETGTAWETDDVLEIRRTMVRFQKNPAMQPLIEKMQSDAALEDFSAADVPEDQLPDLFFAMGARGVSILLQIALADAKDEEDIEGICALSTVRHDLLEANASVR